MTSFEGELSEADPSVCYNNTTTNTRLFVVVEGGLESARRQESSCHAQREGNTAALSTKTTDLSAVQGNPAVLSYSLAS